MSVDDQSMNIIPGPTSREVSQEAAAKARPSKGWSGHEVSKRGAEDAGLAPLPGVEQKRGREPKRRKIVAEPSTPQPEVGGIKIPPLFSRILKKEKLSLPAYEEAVNLLLAAPPEQRNSRVVTDVVTLGSGFLRELYQAKNFQKAKEILIKLTLIEPSHIKLKEGLFDVLMELRDFGGAASYVRQCWDDKNLPEDRRVSFVKRAGEKFANKGEYKDAISCNQLLLASVPDGEQKKILSTIHVLKQREACRIFEGLERAHRHLPFSEFEQHLDTLRSGDPIGDEEAIRAVRHEGRKQLTDLYSDGNFQKAKQVLEKLIFLDPKNLNLRLSLIDVWLGLNEFSECATYLDTLLSLASYPQADKVTLGLQACDKFADKGDYENAIRFSNRLVSLVSEGESQGILKRIAAYQEKLSALQKGPTGRLELTTTFFEPTSLNIERAFTKPRVHKLPLAVFERYLQAMLAAPSQYAHLSKEAVLREGLSHYNELVERKLDLMAKRLLGSLLNFDPSNKELCRKMLDMCIWTHDHKGLIQFAQEYVHKNQPLNASDADFMAYVCTLCHKTKDYSDELVFVEELQKIVPDSRSDAMNAIRARLARFQEINDPSRSGVDPDSRMTKRQVDLAKLIAVSPVLTPEQVSELNDFLTFCLGNRDVSQKLLQASENRRIGHKLSSTYKDIGIVALKTQPENLLTFIAASEKLICMMKKLETIEDFSKRTQFMQMLTQAVGDPFHPLRNIEKLQEYTVSVDQLKAARREQERVGGEYSTEDVTISESEKLTTSDLLAINSFIKNTERLISYQNRGMFRDNPEIQRHIEKGKFAMELVEKLRNVLGAPYQSGDLAFLNFEKEKLMVGEQKKQLWQKVFESHISSFGHAGLVDQSMELDAVRYSEVFGGYTYGEGRFSDFLVSDVYRVQPYTLLSSRGKEILAQRLETLKQSGQISPLMTVDQYVQSIFLSEIEEILSGGVKSEVPTTELEAEVPTEVTPETLLRRTERAQQLEQSRQARLKAYHDKAFGQIHNDDRLQMWAGFRSLPGQAKTYLASHLPSWVSSIPGASFFSGHSPDVKELQLGGGMICSQFQGVAILQALGRTQEVLYGEMADQLTLSERGLASKMAVEVLPSRKGTEERGIVEPSLRSADEQQAYDKALAEIRAQNHFKVPALGVSPASFAPQRVAGLLRECLAPVSMSPLAREILTLDEKFYAHALFPSTPAQAGQ